MRDEGLLQEPTMRLYAADAASLEDRYPMDLARYLRGKSKGPIRLVRPPIFLEGGDYHIDGKGNMFLTQRTLYDNGGDEEKFTELARQYFGAARVHYLRELPSGSANHLDYLMKFTDSDTVLLAKPYGDFDQTIFHRLLSREAREVMAYNESYLREHFPDLRIIHVPFIPAARDSESTFQDFMRQKVLKNLAWKYKYITEAAYKSEQPIALDSPSARKVLAVIEAELGNASLQTNEELDLALRRFFNATLESLCATYSDTSFYYRSYLNSQFLTNQDGDELFLLPRFDPIDTEEQAWMPQAEAETEAAYRLARPKAKIVWVNADRLGSES